MRFISGQYKDRRKLDIYFRRLSNVPSLLKSRITAHSLMERIMKSAQGKEVTESIAKISNTNINSSECIPLNQSGHSNLPSA